MTSKRRKVQRKKETPLPKTDSWQNELTGLNMYARDKRTRTVPTQTVKLSDQELSWLYDSEDLVKKIVQKPVKATLRGGWEVTGLSEQEQTSLSTEYKRLRLLQTIREARYWENLYGGSLLVIGADDGSQDLSRPLAESVRTVRWLQAIPRTWVQIVEWDGPEPVLYQIIPDDGKTPAYLLHASRAYLLAGDSISPQQRTNNEGWGLSVIQPVYNTVRDFVASYDGVFALIQDYGQAVFRMVGLNAALSQKQQSAIKSRLATMDMARSIIQALILDADGGEDFERKSTDVSGLPELLDRFEYRVSAAVDIPVTVLFGRAPGGLNATGESDLENWYARIEEDRLEKIQPIIESITKMLIGRESGWSIKFPPLKVLSESEKADLHLRQAQADKIYLDSGVLVPEEVRQSRFGGDEYTTRTDLIDNVDSEDIAAAIAALKSAEGSNEPDTEGNQEGDSEAGQKDASSIDP